MKQVLQADPILLTIAGFDPSGGAGILADTKTFAAHGVYGMACLTALTVQSTQGVRRVEPLPPSTVAETLRTIAGDARFSAIKIGMLATGEIAGEVVSFLRVHPRVPVVLDPVMESSSGAELLDAAGQAILRRELLARVDWITPNLKELAALTALPVPTSHTQVETAARLLQVLAAGIGNPGLRVVVTGGHFTPPAEPDDLLLTDGKIHWLSGEWVKTNATHGTGCTFSSALAARIARGDTDLDAVVAAKAYVTGAMRAANPIGLGKGPVDHFWQTRSQK